MSLLVRPIRTGDAAGRADLWRDAGRFFASLDPEDNPQSMPFYEHRMGYRPHEVVFRKVLG